MKVVILKDMSAGNDTVGEMWQESKIFEGESTLMEVVQWASNNQSSLHSKVTITVPHGELIPIRKQSDNLPF